MLHDVVPLKRKNGDESMSDNNRPVHQVRIGRIKAAVFENGDNAPRKVQFTALDNE